MTHIIKQSGGTVVMAAGVPVPARTANKKAVQGAAIGGATGAALAGAMMLGPFGIIVVAAIGAGIGAGLGNEADAK